jgi:hypothetical protein
MAPLPLALKPTPAPPRPARLGLEIRSVNSRFLDLSFRLPDELRALEPVLRSLLTAQLKRGKVEVRAAIENDDRQQPARPTPPAATPQLIAGRREGLAAPSRAPQRGRRAAPVRQRQQPPRTGAKPCRPGGASPRTLAGRTRPRRRAPGGHAAGPAQAAAHPGRAGWPLVPLLVEQQRQRFMERWKEAMALTDGSTLPEAARDRALTEATAFAIRIDVAEEITRLNSHLDEIERLLKKGGEVGKRLDFLIQELHREANTLGSKSAALDLTRISVDMKVLIEQMREQVQNIE